MNFFDSSEDTSYEVKDPDLLRMQSQNEKLKEALDEANQTVKQIQNVFTAQTVSFKSTSLWDPRIYWSARINFSVRGSLASFIRITRDPLWEPLKLCFREKILNEIHIC